MQDKLSSLNNNFSLNYRDNTSCKETNVYSGEISINSQAIKTFWSQPISVASGLNNFIELQYILIHSMCLNFGGRMQSSFNLGKRRRKMKSILSTISKYQEGLKVPAQSVLPLKGTKMREECEESLFYFIWKPAHSDCSIPLGGRVPLLKILPAL